MGVEFLECRKFVEGASKYLKPGTAIYNSYIDFIATKMANPIAQYGSSDKPNPKGTPMASAIPGIRHAHLNHDISVFYTVGGRDPTQIKLYGVLSHDESGTQPNNSKTKVQAGVAKQFRNQEFYPGGAVR
jgi:hypothetical protein